MAGFICAAIRDDDDDAKPSRTKVRANSDDDLLSSPDLCFCFLAGWLAGWLGVAFPKNFGPIRTKSVLMFVDMCNCPPVRGGLPLQAIPKFSKENL